MEWIGFRTTAIEIMPPRLQMLKRGGQVVLICGIDELPEPLRCGERESHTLVQVPARVPAFVPGSALTGRECHHSEKLCC